MVLIAIVIEIDNHLTVPPGPGSRLLDRKTFPMPNPTPMSSHAARSSLPPAALILILGGLSLRAATLNVGPNLNTTRSTANNAETTIAINPLNSSNLFVDDTVSVQPRYSTDGGATWQASNTSALPATIGDVSAAWDTYGNLFLAQLSSSKVKVMVGLSINGGASFSLLYETSGTQNDQPTVTVGPSPTPGQGSVWICYTDGSGFLVAQGAAVTGLGQVGAFTAAESTLFNGGDFGDIAVGPNGQVIVAYQDNSTTTGPDIIRINVDPDGLGPAGFGPTINATPTQVGGFVTIPAQPRRSIDAEAGLAWDRSGGPHHGRVYLMYTDRPSTTSNDTDIYVRFSDDTGSTWSQPVRVNDDPLGDGKSQFLPKIALDQTTGNIAVSFYDCRNSAANNTAELWAAVSTDGGVTFSPNVKVSAGVSSALVSAINSTGFDFGDYTGLAFNSGTFYPCWADNSDSTGDNPAGAGGNFDTYTARVTVSTPPPRPTLLAPTLSGANFTFSFQTVAGHAYTAQYSDTLPAAAWLPLQMIIGDGTLKSFSTPIANSPHRFFRLSVQ
jgi:hypothetical protein